MTARAILYLCVVVLLFAGNLLVGKLATASLPPLTLALARMLVAFIAVSALFGRAAWQQREALRRQARALTAMAITGMALFNATLYSALRTTESTNVAVLESMIPAVTALVMALFFRERLGGVKWAGIVMSAFGAAWVVTDGEPLGILQRLQVGDAFVGGAVASWVLYMLAVRRWLGRIPFYASLVPMTGIAVACLAPLSLLENWLLDTKWHLDGQALAAMLYLGIGPSLIALVCYNRALLLVGPSRTATSLNLLPVATMLLGYWLLGTPITPSQIVGAAVTIVGVSLVTLNLPRGW
ncbi:DMT family transporter [Modicisalibacter zincidurans]|uniref:DMT family transporter n=1 Tax=Modicisalibacter zincidurans TaxID=1178777 RepID=A0ABP9R813_9GAMM|nr:DMT family transporter [Halomonas zincidurans]